MTRRQLAALIRRNNQAAVGRTRNGPPKTHAQEQAELAAQRRSLRAKGAWLKRMGYLDP